MTKLSTFLSILICGVIVGLIFYALGSANGLLPVYPDPLSGAALIGCLLAGVVLAGIAWSVWGNG